MVRQNHPAWHLVPAKRDDLMMQTAPKIPENNKVQFNVSREKPLAVFLCREDSKSVHDIHLKCRKKF